MPHGCHRRLGGKTDIAKVQAAELEGALDLFKLDTGRYPTTKEGLKALIQDPGVAGWGGPYMKKEQVPADPWGRPYRYRCPGTQGEYDLWSYGADGVAGGTGEDADVTTWGEELQ